MAPHRILVCDDDAALASTLREQLERVGHVVDLATSVHAACQSLMRCPPALAVVDIHLPPLSGFDVLAFIQERRLRVPVILITAFPSDRVIREATRSGAFRVLSKPFSTHVIVDACATLLRHMERIGA